MAKKAAEVKMAQIAKMAQKSKIPKWPQLLKKAT